MSVPVLRLVSSAAILVASAVSAGGAAAGEPLPLPEEYVEIAEPAPGAVDIVESGRAAAGEHRDRRPAGSRTVGSAEAGPTGEGLKGVAAVSDADAEAPPASRLLRSLDAWSARPAATSPPLSTDGASTDAGETAAGAPIGGVPGSFAASGRSPVPGSSPVLHGCPRALLASLLAEATETADAVSALAIERETLALCRERQEIVNGIVALEGELRGLLAEAQSEVGAHRTGAGTAGAADAPIVKVSAPVRVIEMPTPAVVPAETAETATPPAPEPPSYSWFSIVGTAGDLRAGIGGGGHGGTGGGTSAWFVREGDRLPGGVTVMRIVANPPGVHVGGAVEAALPYRPRPAGTADPRGNAVGDGS